jgi:hypothetical protein
VPAAADDDVVVQRNAERSGGLNDVFGDRDIRLRRCRVAGWMVVYDDQRRGTELERALDDLACVDRRMVDGAALLTLVLARCSTLRSSRSQNCMYCSS